MLYVMQKLCATALVPTAMVFAGCSTTTSTETTKALTDSCADDQLATAPCYTSALLIKSDQAPENVDAEQQKHIKRDQSSGH
jgi:hypothetical protein